MRTAIAYWLIPAEPARGFLEKVIVDLARRYSGPVFEPHLTVHVGADSGESAKKVISKAALGCEPIELEVLDLYHSDEFTKTLFVRLAPNTKLQQLHDRIRNAAWNSSEYRLEPHMSLLYKKMPLLKRRELAESIKLPFSRIVFDSLKAVQCASPTLNRKDVEAWRVLAAESFSGAGEGRKFSEQPT